MKVIFIVMYTMSSIYQNVKLNVTARHFSSFDVIGFERIQLQNNIKQVSSKGEQFAPIDIPTDYWKT